MGRRRSARNRHRAGSAARGAAAFGPAVGRGAGRAGRAPGRRPVLVGRYAARGDRKRSEEHTSELQSLAYLVCRLLLEKKKKHNDSVYTPAYSNHQKVINKWSCRIPKIPNDASNGVSTGKVDSSDTLYWD